MQNSIFPLYVIHVQYFETIPFFYQSKVEFVDQVLRIIYLGSIKAPCRTIIFNQHIMHDADYDDTYRLTPTQLRRAITFMF